MKELNHCPSTLADVFSTYSPTACKKLFDGQKVSHLLDFEIDEISKTSETMIAYETYLRIWSSGEISCSDREWNHQNLADG